MADSVSAAFSLSQLVSRLSIGSIDSFSFHSFLSEITLAARLNALHINSFLFLFPQCVSSAATRYTALVQAVIHHFFTSPHTTQIILQV